MDRTRCCRCRLYTAVMPAWKLLAHGGVTGLGRWQSDACEHTTPLNEVCPVCRGAILS